MSEFVPVSTPKELIESIVRAFADSLAHVSVEEVTDQLVSALYLRVDTTDIGNVIGKQGEMARAIEHILRAASTKLNDRVTLLKVIDNLDVDMQQRGQEAVCA